MLTGGRGGGQETGGGNFAKKVGVGARGRETKGGQSYNSLPPEPNEGREKSR